MAHGVLLIRQHDQANKIEQALADRNQPVFRQAVIESEPLELDINTLSELLSRSWDGVIAVSPAAVDFFQQQITDHGLQWPTTFYYCVGAGTAERLVQHSHQAVTYPAPEHTGEALLALAELQDVNEQNWLFITGANGRPLIAQTLSERGAEVSTLEVYQRRPLHPDLTKKAEQWSEQVAVVVVTSSEQLKLYWEDLPEQAHPWAQSCTWVVSSQRLKNALTDYNVSEHNIILAQNATSEALLKAIPEHSENNMTSADAPKKQTEKQQPENTEPKAKKSWLTGFLIFLLLLSVAVLAAGGYWLWQLQQEVDRTTAQQLNQISERLDATTRSQEQLNQRIADSRQTQHNLQQRQDDTERRLADATRSREELEQDLFSEMQAQVNARFDQLRQQRDAQAEEERRQAAIERQAIREEMSETRTQIDTLQDSVNNASLRVSQDVQLLEARDLVAAANRKIRFEYDPQNAIRLLHHASEILQRARPDIAASVISQIALDIELIEEAPQLDAEGLALQLSELRDQVRALPFDRTIDIPVRAHDSNEVTSSFADWRANLGRAWDSFTEDFIRVQRSEEMPEMRLGAEQRALLKTQLDLQLQIAQQAVIQRQPANYQHAIEQAVEWIESYFSSESAHVAEVVEQLNRLRQQDIEPQLPTRLLSEVMLNDIVDELFGETD